MKKLTFMVACVALLLGGGCFLKANQMNLSLLENIEAFTEGGYGEDRPNTGTCGYVVYMGDTYIRECGIPYSEAYGEYCRWVYSPIYQYNANWCCDSCKNTWYCG